MEKFNKNEMKTQVFDKEKFVVSVHKDEDRFKELGKATLLCKDDDIIEIFAVNTHLDSDKTFLAFRTIGRFGSTKCPPGNWHTDDNMKFMAKLFPELIPFVEKEYSLS